VVLSAGKHVARKPPGVSREDFARSNKVLQEMQPDLATLSTEAASSCASGAVHGADASMSFVTQ
jgi:hypothetical protein